MKIYTNAPNEYDYNYTLTLFDDIAKATTGLNQNPYRVVDVPDEFAHYQCERYSSGMYNAVTEEQFNELVKFQIIQLMRGDK